MADPKDRYLAAAAEHGRCTESGDYKRGNVAFDRMIAALAELRKRADRGQRGPHAAGAPRGAAALSAVPRESVRGKRSARTFEFSDARRLHSLPCRHSRFEFRR